MIDLKNIIALNDTALDTEIQKVLLAHPTLIPYGYNGDPKATDFITKRQEFFTSSYREEIRNTLRVLSNHTETKRYVTNSYDLKHRAEKQGGEKSVCYVSNGSAIVACVIAGLRIQTFKDYPDSPNVLIAVKAAKKP